MANRPDYGLDAPGVVRGLAIGGGVALLLGVATLRFVPALGVALLVTGTVLAGEALYMVWSSRVGKLKARDALFDRVHLSGPERVLDVGCGRGLLMIGAAKRLLDGHATGIDLWSQGDLSGNSREAALENARLEGVESQIDVRDGDVRRLPFENACFDVVVSSLAIHNIRDREERRQAIREIVRVLKPGGRVALQDFRNTHDYALDLAAAGCVEVSESEPSFLIFPPVNLVTGKKRG